MTDSVTITGSCSQRVTAPATSAPRIGASQNSHSCATYSLPPNSAGPVLRAGLTDVLVTGIDTRWISVRASPIGNPANPAAAPLEVQPMMIIRKKKVIRTSITKHERRLYLPGLRSPKPFEANPAGTQPGLPEAIQ